VTNSSTRKILVGTVPVDLPGHGLRDELLDQEDSRRDRRRRKLCTQPPRDAGGPLRRCRSDDRDFTVGDRRRGDEGNQLLVLVVQHSRLDLLELRLEDVLYRLGLDAVPPYLELRVDSAEEVHTLRPDVDPAFVPGAVETPEPRVRDELLSGLLRQVAVAARNVNPTNAKLSDLPVGQRVELADFEDDVGDVGERRADGHGLPRSQALAACVGARLRRAVGVDDLPSTTRPRLHERGGEGFARRNDVAAQRVREIQLGSRCEGGQQHWRTEQHRDLGFTEDRDEIRTRPDLLLGQQDHGATRNPSTVHLGDASVVSQ